MPDDTTHDHSRFAGTKILVVDDDAESLRILERFVKKRGYVFIGASDGKQAMAQVHESQPTVALIDVGLPDTNGMELLQEIKKYNPSIGVILISGWAHEVLGSQVLEVGAFDFVTKPVDFRHLDELLWFQMTLARLEDTEQ